MKSRKFFIFSAIALSILIGKAFITNVSVRANQSPLGLPIDTPAYKMQAAQKEQNLIDEAKKNALTSKKGAVKVLPLGELKQDAPGIVAANDGMIPSKITKKYTINNKWVGTIENKSTTVLAGVSKDNQKQGVIILLQTEDNGIDFKFYPTSGLDGSLTISKVDGNNYTMTSSSGEVYNFDISTKSLTHK